MGQNAISEASLPGRADGSSLHHTGWSKKNPVIYLSGDKVVFSASWEFLPGLEMSPEQIRSAKARGFIFVNVLESTTTPAVDTVAASAGRRVPGDPYIMLCEIDIDKISEIYKLRGIVNLCDFGLRYLDQEFEQYLHVLDFCLMVNQPDEVFDQETIAEESRPRAHRTPGWKKRQAAKRYRNKRTALLRKKREAERKASVKVMAKVMSGSKKTATRRKQCRYNVESIEWHGDFAEYMKAYHHPPKAIFSETRQNFAINGKVYSVPSSIIESIEEGLIYVIKTGAEHFIQFTDDTRIEVRELLKVWL
jgi:hypothetical protein